MHIWAFVSKINQPSNRQPNKKPPGKTEEVQKTVEVPREEHYHRQRVLGGKGEKNHARWVKESRADNNNITTHYDYLFHMIIYTDKLLQWLKPIFN